MSCSSAASGEDGRLCALRCSRFPFGVVDAVLEPPPPHAASAATGPAAATATPDRTSRRRDSPDVISSSLREIHPILCAPGQRDARDAGFGAPGDGTKEPGVAGVFFVVTTVPVTAVIA